MTINYRNKIYTITNIHIWACREVFVVIVKTTTNSNFFSLTLPFNVTSPNFLLQFPLKCRGFYDEIHVLPISKILNIIFMLITFKSRFLFSYPSVYMILSRGFHTSIPNSTSSKINSSSSLPNCVLFIIVWLMVTLGI